MRAGVLRGAVSAAGQAPAPPHPDTTMGTVMGTSGWGLIPMRETGPGVLSGTGQQLAGKRLKEGLRGRDLQVLRNGGWMAHRVMDTASLSGRSAG